MRPPGGAGLIRRVFDSLFGPAVPPPRTTLALQDRLEVTAVVLAGDLASDPSLGFVPADARPDDPEACAQALLPVARRLAWVRWLWEIGKLDPGGLDGEPQGLPIGEVA